MQYMLLIYDTDAARAQRTPEQFATLMSRYHAFTQDIVKSGHYRAGSSLAATSAAKTVRQQGGRPVTTDGPYAETRESLGGYYLIEAVDEAEAVAIAGRIPSVAAGGAVEVRPLTAVPEPARVAPAS